ncbi:DNA adenine methylase [Treponema sp. C6A8]|uniref:DNA adenine methylase n=1 Tax=Treponema sp. C6A8 TaxID=1410609 RepID=UPI0004804E11|nr:DNA adenine methylase [Treponema sp. C6A8]
MSENKAESQAYLTEQLITYLGNKRALLPFIGQGISIVQSELGRKKLSCLDLFSGSGIVARYLKQFASYIAVNDLENYSCIINRCYLADKSEVPAARLAQIHDGLTQKLESELARLQGMRAAGNHPVPGFITRLYSPADENNIQKNDRCFYTTRNANYLDLARQLIDSEVPEDVRHFFIAPLLSEASIHANTSGVFKGFYKNSKTGIGQFGGNGKNALSRILGDIELKLPVFSEFECPSRVFNMNANELVTLPELYEAGASGNFDGTFDLAYFDPPYNQHPYGSNYFMLNLVASYKEPDTDCISRVSGIPSGWNRSSYNKKRQVAQAFLELVKNVRARYVLISFNSEGFIGRDEMIELMNQCGSVRVLESDYNTFRGSRNLKARDIHVKEYLFLIKKNIC